MAKNQTKEKQKLTMTTMVTTITKEKIYNLMNKITGNSFFVSGSFTIFFPNTPLMEVYKNIPTPAPRYNNPAIIVGVTYSINSFEKGILMAYKAAANNANNVARIFLFISYLSFISHNKELLPN